LHGYVQQPTNLQPLRVGSAQLMVQNQHINSNNYYYQYPQSIPQQSNQQLQSNLTQTNQINSPTNSISFEAHKQSQLVNFDSSNMNSYSQYQTVTATVASAASPQINYSISNSHQQLAAVLPHSYNNIGVMNRPMALPINISSPHNLALFPQNPMSNNSIAIHSNNQVNKQLSQNYKYNKKYNKNNNNNNNNNYNNKNVNSCSKSGDFSLINNLRVRNKNITPKTNSKVETNFEITDSDKEWPTLLKQNETKLESENLEEKKVEENVINEPYLEDETKLKKLIKNVDFIKRTVEQHYLNSNNHHNNNNNKKNYDSLNNKPFSFKVKFYFEILFINF
jgi:hypothetical protein